MARMCYGRSLTVQLGQVVCGTVYWDMHFKDLLGSIARVGYCIPVPDFYIVLHDEKALYRLFIYMYCVS